MAFAYGAGLPWEDLWAPLESKLSGRDYTDKDLIWLRCHRDLYLSERVTYVQERPFVPTGGPVPGPSEVA